MAPASFTSKVSITHITTATALINIDGLNFITDPAFNEAPIEYDITHLFPNTTEKKTTTMLEGPKRSLASLPIIHCVLLSHEDHIDNLDDSGRQLLISRHVITTPDGAKNLSEYPAAESIESWQTKSFLWRGDEWHITGVPATHLPGGESTGFILHKASFGKAPDGRPNVLYFTGDTILKEDVVELIKEKYHVVVALMSLGNAHVPWDDSPSGLLQITMGGKDASRMFRLLDADVLVPMHYESWLHFTEHGEKLRDIFTEEGIIEKVAWLNGEGKDTPIV